jgi:hypothetical protein
LHDRADGGEVKWQGVVRLPPELRGDYTDVVSGAERRGGELALAEAFADFPVALLGSFEAGEYTRGE